MTDELAFRLITAGVLLTGLTVGGYFRRKAEREGGAAGVAKSRANT